MSDYNPPDPLPPPLPIFNNLNWVIPDVITGGGGGGAQGYQGPTGPFGGPAGPQGFRGFQGFQGLSGIQGVEGIQGFQGLQGDGIQGFQGIAGPTGPGGGGGSVIPGENIYPSVFASVVGMTGIQGSTLENNNTVISTIPTTYFNVAGSIYKTAVFAGGDYYYGTMNATGQYRYMCPSGASTGYRSENFGKTWTSFPLLGNAGYPKTDNTGQYVFIPVGDPGVFMRSSDYGITFANIFAPAGVNNWTAVSASGKYVYITSTGAGVYRSDDYGLTFTLVLVDTTTQFYDRVNCSASGQYILIPAGLSSSGVRLSSDYGTTWTYVTAPGSGQGAIAYVSSSGQFMYYDVFAGSQFFKSSDYGKTFTALATPGGFGGFYPSANGQYLYGVGYLGGNVAVTVSADFGNTFQTIYVGDPNENIFNPTVSGSGQYVMIVGRYTTLPAGTNSFCYTLDMSLSRTDQSNIVLNATGNCFANLGSLSGATGFYVAPIQQRALAGNQLCYDPVNNEIYYV